MRRHQPDLGHQCPQALRDLVHILDAGTDIERLTAPELFAKDRLANHDRIVGHDERTNRQPVDRRRADEAKFAHPGQCQLQGARYRRRGQGEHMHVGAQLFEPFFMRYAEMLLFIDNK